MSFNISQNQLKEYIKLIDEKSEQLFESLKLTQQEISDIKTNDLRVLII